MKTRAAHRQALDHKRCPNTVNHGKTINTHPNLALKSSGACFVATPSCARICARNTWSDKAKSERVRPCALLLGLKNSKLSSWSQCWCTKRTAESRQENCKTEFPDSVIAFSKWITAARNENKEITKNCKSSLSCKNTGKYKQKSNRNSANYVLNPVSPRFRKFDRNIFSCTVASVRFNIGLEFNHRRKVWIQNPMLPHFETSKKSWARHQVASSKEEYACHMEQLLESETKGLNTLVPITNENGAVLCDATTTRIVELAIALAWFAEFGDKAAIWSEDWYTMVAGVADICVVCTVECDGVWSIELSRSWSGATDFAQKLSRAYFEDLKNDYEKGKGELALQLMSTWIRWLLRSAIHNSLW